MNRKVGLAGMNRNIGRCGTKRSHCFGYCIAMEFLVLLLGALVVRNIGYLRLRYAQYYLKVRQSGLILITGYYHQNYTR